MSSWIRLSIQRHFDYIRVSLSTIQQNTYSSPISKGKKSVLYRNYFGCTDVILQVCCLLSSLFSIKFYGRIIRSVGFAYELDFFNGFCFGVSFWNSFAAVRNCFIVD